MFYTRCYVALIIMEQYPTLEKLYYNHVECRYGTIEKLHISKYYNDELTYEEINIKFVNNTMIGEDGTIYYPRTK